ncbi:MAG: peptidoglycan-binding protein [Synechococcales cyanobacterium C42_A2020_086]|jgi:hypothetical protein|nr:peptidoglycan-binding protein [Synechococcales cyanobacterium C42_A2020_086]
METFAYLQAAQDYETPESKELKLSGKAAATVLSVAGAALAVGVTDVAPAQAHDYYGGYDCGVSVQKCFIPVSTRCFDPCYGYSGYGVSYDYGYDYGYKDYGYDYSYDYGYKDYGYYEPVSYYPDYYYGYDKGCGVSYGGCGGGYIGVSSHFSTYDIQVALNHAGFPVIVDGVFGPETHSAVIAFQISCGLVPDGIVGPATASALGLI